MDYAAFCSLHQDAYLRYSEARLRQTEAGREAVQEALGGLLLVWTAALGSSCPAAMAWDLLKQAVLRAQQYLPSAAPPVEAAYQELPNEVADAVVLCGDLSLSVQQAAEVMGVEEPVVRSRLRIAQRTLLAR
ncbi:hypothetical protein ACIRVI_00155 [[Kitasatospora] papulosa]|uniref:hypothetical protein n=1 Tax=Streptomyces TaxID=1883 RepID=UPI0025B33A76|nr:hypothetical protein [Streptomyces sp. P9-2B-1]WJY35436.1 hypothetical protein QTO28_32345 [Streptomyces sp. P9-2B-1]